MKIYLGALAVALVAALTPAQAAWQDTPEVKALYEKAKAEGKVMIWGTQQGEVDADDHQGHFALVALDDQRGGGDGFVRALGSVALCRAPHAGVDAHGGSDVASRNADKRRGGGRDDFKLLFCLGQWHEWCIPCDAESVWSMARRFQAERGFCRRTCASFN